MDLQTVFCISFPFSILSVSLEVEKHFHFSSTSKNWSTPDYFISYSIKWNYFTFYFPFIQKSHFGKTLSDMEICNIVIRMSILHKLVTLKLHRSSQLHCVFHIIVTHISLLTCGRAGNWYKTGACITIAIIRYKC